MEFNNSSGDVAGSDVGAGLVEGAGSDGSAAGAGSFVLGAALVLRGFSLGGGSIGSFCALVTCVVASARSTAVARRQKLLPRKYLDSVIGRDIFVGLRAFALACS